MALSADQVLAGGVRFARKRVTGNYTATLTDHIIEVAAGSAAATITLPDAATCDGYGFIIKRYSNSDSGQLFIATDGGRVQNANGSFSTSQGVSSANSFRNVLYVSDGVDYLFIGI